ncbi:hypothetical protein RN001_014409 [Aquatica leii]|uniref:Farnesyl pyrophosphate synthase n=1 Tax=Aquatica leii TaxID=1421715 RepID=A0AAN7NUI4_9COLE|nr:hypothetical protein RN001_014409 [Aquatica leii]
MSQILRHVIRRYSLNKTKPKPLSVWLTKDSNSADKDNKLAASNIGLEEEIHQAFISTYPQIVRDCIPRNWDNELTDVIARFDKLCNHAEANRTLYASPTLINAYRVLADKSQLTSKNMELVYILAWCFELSLLSLCMLDDVLDEEEMRWRKPTWHTLPNIGVTVAADIRLVHDSVWILLKKYFKNHPSYVALSDLLTDCIFKTCYGQTIDTNTASKFKIDRDVNLISMNTYKSIVKYKDSYGVFIYPTLAAMYLENNIDCNVIKTFGKILDKFTMQTQASNDMLDCYGNYSSFCRVGKDIEKGKCTWLSATTVQHASQKQLELFLKHYGKEELQCQEIVKNIYKEIGVVEKYYKYKSDLIRELEEDTQSIPDPRLHHLMHILIDTYINADEDFINN